MNSALGSEGNCTSCFKRVMCISCQQHVDIHIRVRRSVSWRR